MRGLLATALTAVFLCAPAIAEPAPDGCKKRMEVLENLISNWNENTVALGLGHNGTIVELTKTPDGATFTILMTWPDGRSCAVAAGEFWQSLKSPKKGKPL